MQDELAPGSSGTDEEQRDTPKAKSTNPTAQNGRAIYWTAGVLAVVIVVVVLAFVFGWFEYVERG